MPWLFALRTAIPALAAPRCEPVDATAFREALSRARSQIDHEELTAFGQTSAEVLSRIPCLNYVPSPDDWAQFLVGVAVVAHFRGEDWQTPLGAALRVAPNIDRGVGPGHEMAQWDPPPSPLGRPVPDRGEWYVDGRLADALPPPAELHLVQVRTDDGFRSAVLHGQEVPDTWLGHDSPPLAVIVSAAAGARAVSQLVDSQGDYVADAASVGGAGGVLAQAWLGGLPAVAVRVEGTLAPRGELAAGVRLGALFVGAGVAADRPTYRSLYGTVGRLGFTPALSAHFWPSDHLDLGAVGGWSPAASYARGEVGARRGSWARAGVELGWGESQWMQDARRMQVSEVGLVATCGVAWGR